MDLPNEMWMQIICFLRYIDAFNFPVTCERFHLVSLSYKAYRERLVLSHEVFGFDPNTCYEFIKKCLHEVSENICLGFSGMFKSRKYLKSILNIKLKKDIMSFCPSRSTSIYSLCQRGIRDVARCNFCTRFFLE